MYIVYLSKHTYKTYIGMDPLCNKTFTSTKSNQHIVSHYYPKNSIMFYRTYNSSTSDLVIEDVHIEKYASK